SKSTDGSPHRIRSEFPTVRVLELDANLGPSVARNTGLKSVDSPLVLLIDHDVYVESGAITALAEALCAQPVAVVCPRVRLMPERNIVQTDGAAVHFLGTMILNHAYQPIDAVIAQPGVVGGCISACLLVDRSVVLSAGGFEELYFFHFEDLEFSLRLRAMGHVFFHEPLAEVFHDRGHGTPGLSFRNVGAYPVQRAQLTMRYRLATILIHYRLRTLLLLLPALMLYEIATFVVAVRRGWSRQWAQSWLWQIQNGSAIASRRRRMRRLRKVPDRKLLIGGPPPLAPGTLESTLERGLVRMLSQLLNAYWRLVKTWIG
ncbi:MAG: glycosyltransferase, partial [Pseudomonadota bacterium]